MYFCKITAYGPAECMPKRAAYTFYVPESINRFLLGRIEVEIFLKIFSENCRKKEPIFLELA